MELLQDLTRGCQGAFGAEDISSGAMKRGILRWHRLFTGQNDSGQDHCLQLPYTIVRKLTRAVFAEYDPQGPLALLPHREAMELAMVCGESYLKPIPTEDGYRFAPVSRGNVLVFGRDLWGEPRDVGLMEKRLQGHFYYTLLERRTLSDDGMLTVTNRLFKSTSRTALGREVPLNSLKCYENLPRKALVREPLGLIRLKMPMLNSVDGSREGVSVYAPAVELLEAIGENEHQLRQEFANGASRLVVSRDLLSDGQLKDRVFVALDDSPEAVGITLFAPQLREQSYLNRQQAYLRSLENLLGLKRGLLSQVEAVDRTATEITSSEGEYMSTIFELRRAWEEAARSALDTLSTLTGEEIPEPKFHWGDGVL